MEKEIIFRDIKKKYLEPHHNGIKWIYDKTPIYETCVKLVENNYRGLVVIKSTIEPETTNILSEKPFICGLKQQIPLTIKIILTPA